MLKKIQKIGPGAMVTAAFIGPGTVTTATLAGSSFGYTLLWAVTFSIIALWVLQEMSARLGVIGKIGLGEAIRTKIHQPLLKKISIFLVISAILIGNTAYQAGNITGAVWGAEMYFSTSSLPFNPLVLAIGLLVFFLLFTGKYQVIEKVLVGIVALMGIVFLATALYLQPDWIAVLEGMFVPKIPDNSLMMILGLIGTTVVPYNFFLHAAAAKEKWKEEVNLFQMRQDMFLSLLLGGLITMAILITASVAFESSRKSLSQINELAFQLKPLMNNWASVFVAFGFFSAGFSSAITAPLAAGLATSEIMGWEKNLKGLRFRIIWGFVLGIGILFSSLGFKPTYVILFAQIANGILLPVIAFFLLWVMNDAKLMKENRNSILGNVLGMIILLLTLVLGLKGILTGLKWI